MDKMIPQSYPNNCVPTTEQLYTSPVAQVNGQLVPYPQFVYRLFKCMDNHPASLAHAAVGVSGEAGELLDAVKKHWVYGKPLDRANIVEELGDLRFYMMALQLLLGISDMEVITANAEKLAKRYPAGEYSDSAAIDRADKQ